MDSTNHNVLQLVSAAAQVLESQDSKDLADENNDCSRTGHGSVSERQREEIKELLAEATGGHVELDCEDEHSDHTKISKRKDYPKERSTEERLKLIFGLPTTEKLRGAWPCCIVRSAIVPGTLYLTENRICFYASLPRNEMAYRKSGYLMLKTAGTMATGFERFYFELKSDNLAWYESATDMYSPKGKIDLKDVLAVKQSKRREFGFKLVTMEKTLHFQADTKASLIEWTNVFQKAIFKAKSSGNSLKISLPFGNIIDIEQTEAFEFQQFVQIRAVGIDDSFVLDEYYFAYFNDIKTTFDHLVRVWKGQSGNVSESMFSEECMSMSTTSGSVSPSLSIADLYDADARPITIPALSSRLSALTLESIPAEHREDDDNRYRLQGSDPSAIDVNDSSSSEDEESAVVGWLDGKRKSGMKLVYNLLGAKTGSAATVYNEEQEQERVDNADKEQEVTEASPLSGGDSHRATFPHEDPIEERTRLNFRKYFVLPESEKLCAVYQCSLMKTLPCYGKLYISTNYVCFNSKGFATKTKVIIPFSDIVRIQKIRSRGYVFHALSILTQNKKEIFIEFSSIVKRNSCFARLYLQHKWANEDTASSKENEKEILDWEARLLEEEQKVSSTYSTSMINAGLPVLSNSHIEFPSYERPSKPLHFTCVTIGTRGDVQPYIALCKGLMKEGHKCRIATHDEFQKWIEGHGIEFRSIGGDPSELMRICVENNFFSVHFIMEGLRLFKHWIDELLTLTWQACQGTDVLIESPSAMVGVHMAEKLRIPYFRSFPMPMTRTRSFPHPFATPNNPKGRLYNDMTYVLFDHAVWRAIATRTNDFRRNVLHLPPTTYEKLEIWKIPYLYCFSPNIVPSPLDWMDWIHCTGYWFLDNPDNGWTPSAKLEAFIKASDPRPLVYIGFGSIIVSDPKEITRIIVEAARSSNVRAIISSGWASRLQKGKSDEDDDDILSRYPDTIFGVESVPHDWLFPQMRAVVHHGGAGTTAAGLRAGVPTIVKPFFADQFFWGERVEEMGIGICIKNLTVESLSAALRVVSTDEAMLRTAKIVGERIRKENGVETAIQCIYRDMELAKARTLSSAQRTASEQQGAEDEDEWTLIDANASGSISPGSWRPTTG